jgi:hypothetical protein
MQKALTQMNIQLANAIADMMGETGQKIVRAIIAGERDPQTLANMRNFRIRAGEEEIVKSLQCNWRQEHLFVLKQGGFVPYGRNRCYHRVEGNIGGGADSVAVSFCKALHFMVGFVSRHQDIG